MDKWIAENDRTLSTTTWLTYERLNRECVQCLKCSVCIRFRDKLVNSTRLIKSFECPIKNYFERTLCQSNISTLTAALQYCTIQYSTIQYSTIQYSRVQYSTIQHSTIQYSTIQYSTIQYSTIQYSRVQYSTIQYNTVKYSTVQYNTVEYSTVQHSTEPLTGRKMGVMISMRGGSISTARRSGESPQRMVGGASTRTEDSRCRLCWCFWNT